MREKKEKQLNNVRQAITACQRCPLGKTATKSVPGEGNPEAEVVFIGEAPGYWEDQKGIPFCGAAGHLLDQLLTTINLVREEVFITNILKHRPPNNRDPLPAEIAACTPFLRKQLLIIKPSLVVTLGRFALNFFLPHAYISRVHGQKKEINWEGLNLILVPLFHPAAALRNPQIAHQLREDFLSLPQIIRAIKEKKKKKEKKEKSSSPQQETLF